MKTLTIPSYWIILGLAKAGNAQDSRRPMPEWAKMAVDAAGFVCVLVGGAALALAMLLWLEPVP